MGTVAPRTAREHARAELTRAILASARRQLAGVGPAALSVRAVARDRGMVSSATYRYFRSRERAPHRPAHRRLRRAADLAGRWRAICHALRCWAIANRHEYALLYGSPVPGYAAPEETIPAASRVPLTLLALAHDAEENGLPLRAPVLALPEAETAALGGIRNLTNLRISDERLVRSLMAWTTLFGHVSMELFGHMHRAILDYDAHFAHVVATLAADLGIGSGDLGVECRVRHLSARRATISR